MSLRRNAAFVAATAGLAALANHFLDQAAEGNAKPTGRLIDIDGTRLHVMDTGQGPPVLYLHGNGAMIQEVQATGLVEKIARDHRLIVIDRPGFGLSSRPRDRDWTPEAQADLIAKLLTKLAVDPVTVIAHSWGTMVALALAAHHGERVRGLVLASGYYFPTIRADSVLSVFAMPVVGDAVRHTVGPLAARVMAPAAFARIFAPDEVTPRFKAEYPIDLAVRASQLRAVSEEAGEMAAAAGRLSRHYGRIECPVAILAGTDDAIVDAEQSTRLSHDLADSDLELVEGRGHMLPHVVPASILRALARIENRGTVAASSSSQGSSSRLSPRTGPLTDA